jgi:8-oxo-dGTP pyrophosphatase MutT (NUDIX family)
MVVTRQSPLGRKRLGTDDPSAIDVLLQCRLPMLARNSAVAIIVVDRSHYLMQLRDEKPTIFYPGHWGLFGGAVDSDERPEQSVRRELEEELGFRPEKIDFLTEFEFDLDFVGATRIYRRYYEVHTTLGNIASFRLGEGSAMKVFSPEALFKIRVTPYDSFALYLHYLKQCEGGTLKA